MSHIASSFFHYTKKKEYLISILENKFYPRYCYENYAQFLPNYTKEESDIAVPMVCFCDIPLTLISEHTEEYGEYAIGLSKDWGVKNLSPIFYLLTGSIPYNNLNKIQKQILFYDDFSKNMFFENNKTTKKMKKTKSLIEKEQKNRFKSWMDFIGFIKPYTGISYKTKKEKEFYREREWRWIPKITIEDEKEGLILRFTKKDGYSINDKNELIKNTYSLNYEICDITYIIVPNDEDKKEIINVLYNFKDEQNLDDVLLLISKIISINDIKQNF